MSATVASATAGSPALRLRVQNVVAVARVADTLPLVGIAEAIPGAEYPRGTYPGIVIRLAGPRVSCHVFDSGKIVLTGLGDVGHLEPAYAAVIGALRGAGIALADPLPEARVINLVASGHLGERVSLFRLAVALELERVEYDPEHFAGLVYRAPGGGTALLFASGALVIMGARSVEQALAVANGLRDAVDATGSWQCVA